MLIRDRVFTPVVHFFLLQIFTFPFFLDGRFSPVKADTSVTLYWIRSNREGSDNAAIESTSLDPNYR